MTPKMMLNALKCAAVNLKMKGTEIPEETYKAYASMINKTYQETLIKEQLWQQK